MSQKKWPPVTIASGCTWSCADVRVTYGRVERAGRLISLRSQETKPSLVVTSRDVESSLARMGLRGMMKQVQQLF